ncbi:MAG: hypothetical protein HGA53_04295 [Anaerolineaceae bacterium]|nr:hypothetical protein [Anaerolineaceae bacterium]
MLEQLRALTTGFTHRFPEGNNPFQIMTRLLEEGGELAQMVNHFEGTGIKTQKYGEPDKAKLAKEVKDALLCVLQVADHYDIWPEVESTLQQSYEHLKAEGHIPA